MCWLLDLLAMMATEVVHRKMTAQEVIQIAPKKFSNIRVSIIY